MGTTHNHTYSLSEQYEFSGKPKTWSLAAIVIGTVGIIVGFVTGHGERTFASLLQMAYYFTCVCAAGTFFLALQYVAQAGWSASLLRVPQAFARVLPIAAAILFAICAAGLFIEFKDAAHGGEMVPYLYKHWATKGLAEHDHVIAGKASYLNKPFFLLREFVFMAAYSIFAVWFTKASANEDLEGGLNTYKKSFRNACIFLVIFGFTTPIWAFDTIMSLEAHWFSTMFGWYNFAAMWVSGMSAITLTILLLRRAGYMSWLNDSHLHDLGKFMFAFSIFWTYVWFAQFLLIWYANMSEETVYFKVRFEHYKFWFWLNILMNFASPVLILMSRDNKRKEKILMFVSIFLLCGHWLDYYLMVMPGTAGEHYALSFEHGSLPIPELGAILFFVGLFTYLMLSKLAERPLIPKNHPFLQESLHHHI